ncbi:MAG: hypothetical protein QW727_01740 [Candidatus Pacearchaeota archaeon]
MIIKFKNKFIKIKNIQEARGFNIFRGLMFRRKNKSPVFLFNSKSSLHSFFVFFPFLVLWLDKKNNVADFKIVYPFLPYINTKKEYKRILEIPISKKNYNLVKIIVEERFKKK